VMQKQDVDYVIVSEGEYVLLELIKTEMHNRDKIPDIHGLFYRRLLSGYPTGDSAA